MKLLDLCKKHQGPVTADWVNLLDNLTEKELINEICYLRATVAPDIRQMRREKVDGKFKMIRFTYNELKQSIRNAVKLESNLTNDIHSLLRAI